MLAIRFFSFCYYVILSLVPCVGRLASNAQPAPVAERHVCCLVLFSLSLCRRVRRHRPFHLDCVRDLGLSNLLLMLLGVVGASLLLLLSILEDLVEATRRDHWACKARGWLPTGCGHQLCVHHVVALLDDHVEARRLLEDLLDLVDSGRVLDDLALVRAEDRHRAIVAALLHTQDGPG